MSKRLSDSSTSESEDDLGKRLQNKICYDSHIGLKRRLSSDGSQEHESYQSGGASSNSSFKSPQKYSERHFSTDDTEDEHTESLHTQPKKFKRDLINEYNERELSTDPTDSESGDDRSSMAKVPFKASSSNDALSENYGVGMKMMEKMGFKLGTGLGKNAQGRVNIVEASKQRGRRGLGLEIKGLESNEEEWDFSQDPISFKEDVMWIPETKFEPIIIKELREWSLEGKIKETIDDETDFCDPDILEKVIAYKSVFDKLEGEEMRKARAKSNPFETIRGGIFLNRAAMKMANMDTAFDFMFTNPVDKSGRSLVGRHELLYFADVCAGPGGFSEYVLWKKKWEAKGFGFTLNNSNDFKLSDFFSGPPETFEPFYGEEKDGDIYKPSNLRSLKKFVLSNTDEKGVHFVMADGGFSVEGKENLQEILSKRLYLCQFQCALSILRTGGHFVCKLFDIFTPFSVGLIYLMYMAFEKVCVFKPNTSRPANSERYLVCKWLKENTRDICDYMFELNETFHGFDKSDKDIREVVPLHILKENDTFYQYILESNNVLGARQIHYLDKIRAFAQNVNLVDSRQNDIRTKCLELWQVPDQVRQAPKRGDPSGKFTTLLQGENFKYLSQPPESLEKSSLKKLENIFDFRCVVCGEATPVLFLSLGRSYIYQWDPNKYPMIWSKLENCILELPEKTLFYGEILLELKGEHRAQKKIMCIHIIDVLYLGGMDVRNYHYEERMQIARKFAKAVAKPSHITNVLVRVKKVWELRNIKQIFDKLMMKVNKGNQLLRISYDLDDTRHIIPSGLLIFKSTADPWVTAFSKKMQKVYLFHTKENTSSFEKRKEANASFKSCFESRLLWKWGRGVRLIPDQDEEDSNATLLHGNIVEDFIQKRERFITGK